MSISLFDFRLCSQSDDYYEQFFYIRNEELRIPLGLTLNIMDRADDQNQILGVGIIDKQVVCGLLLKVYPKGVYKMRQVATSKSYQGLGYGKQLVKATEQFIQKIEGKRIELHARKEVEPFYLALGYSSSEEEFTEVGIPHVFMWKDL